MPETTLEILIKKIGRLEQENRLLTQSTDQLHGLDRYLLEIFDNTPAPIYMKDSDGRYVLINRRFEMLAHISLKEIIGKKDDDVFPEDVATMFRVQDEEVKRENRSLEFEETLCLPDGKFTFITQKFPIHDANGKILGVAGFCTDITERKKTEDELLRALVELKRAGEQLRVIFNTSQAGIIIVNPEGVITVANQRMADMFGYTLDELIGTAYTEHLHPGEKKLGSGRMHKLISGEIDFVYAERRYLRKDGSDFWGYLSGRRHEDEKGNLLSLVGVIADITERKQAEEKVKKLNADLSAHTVELEKVNEELESFSYTVSHDLRKPLTVIKGYCEIIQDLWGHDMKTQCREYLQEICSGADSMNRLIDDLLKFSLHMHAEQRRESIDLSEIANAVAAELALNEPRRDVTFRIAEGITATGDANLLRVVLENLLGNAWKYTGKQEGAVIEFGMMEVEGIPTFFVRDNGIGFDMAQADKLFTPFQRLHRKEAEGHGIGLATVERIIKRHDGKVWAEGEPGKGAAFYFTL